MADEDVGVDLEFDLKDKVSAKLSRIERGVDALDKKVNSASARFAAFGHGIAGMMGVYGLGQSISAAKQYIDHVDKIANLTGLAADRVAGMSEALQVTGVDASEVEGILGRMVKRGALANEGQKMAAAMARRYGVDLKEGPEKSLVKMAKLVEDQKIGAGQVGRILGVQGDTLANLMDAMGKGPAELNRMFDEAIDKNKFLGGEAMDQMQSYDESVNRVGLAWRRLVAGLVVKLAPSMEKLASKFEDSIEGWSDKAQRFASFMVNHMTTIIAMAKTYAKIMLVNNLAMRITGGKAGVVGLLGGAGKFVASGKIGNVGGGIGGVIMSVLGAFKSVFTGASKLGPLIGVIGRFTVVGTIVALVIEGFKHIGSIVSALKERFGGVFSRIWESLKHLGASIAELFSEDSGLGRGIRWLGEKFMEVLGGLLEGASWVISELSIRFAQIAGWKTRADVLSDRGAESTRKYLKPLADLRGVIYSLTVGKGPVTAEQRERFKEIDKAYTEAKLNSKGATGYAEQRGYITAEQYGKLKARYGGAGPGKGGTPETSVYQDFRNSRFDITQQFAEGFDPDRIAVAFANDVASIGERKLQSGFAPLFTVR